MYKYCMPYSCNPRKKKLIYSCTAASGSRTAKNQYWNSRQIFRKKGIARPQPNFHIHVYLSDWYIPTIDLPILLQEIWEYINSSQTHECRNCDWGRAISRKEIHKWDFRCSAVFINAHVRVQIKSLNFEIVIKDFLHWFKHRFSIVLNSCLPPPTLSESFEKM